MCIQGVLDIPQHVCFCSFSITTYDWYCTTLRAHLSRGAFAHPLWPVINTSFVTIQESMCTVR